MAVLVVHIELPHVADDEATDMDPHSVAANIVEGHVLHFAEVIHAEWSPF